MERYCLQVYTGNGKGKSTAAAGLCLRALGRNKKVALISFLKNGSSGECSLLSKLGAMVDFGNAPTEAPWVEAAQKDWQKHSKEQMDKALNIAEEGEFDILVLDEILAAFHKEYITQEEIEELISFANGRMEIVVTGRNAPEWLIEQANLVSEIQEIKHYYQEGILAREGIEF